MTDNHPTTPPPELVEQWVTEVWHEGTPARLSLSDMHIATQAARWGADQELEACCALMDRDFMAGPSELRAARRPKPPSLKEQALLVLEDVYLASAHYNIIRQALEALPDD